MTEKDWLMSTNLRAMLNYLTRGNGAPRMAGGQGWRVTERQLRFFDAALVWASKFDYPGPGYANWDDGEPDEEEHDNQPCHEAYLWCDTDYDNPGDPPMPTRIHLLRDIVGNPWKPLTVSAAWLTPTVQSLAEAAYQNRLMNRSLDYAHLDVLSDALEEAGCIGLCDVCNENGFVTIYADDPSFPQNLGSATHLFASGIPRLCHVCKGNKEVVHPIVVQLRCRGPHYRGCRALEVLREQKE